MKVFTGNCGSCGRESVNIYRVHEGINYCATCRESFERVPCASQCGQFVRVPPGHEPTLCRSCQAKLNAYCDVCGEKRRTYQKLEDGRRACVTCYRAHTKPKPCPACGNEAKVLLTAKTLGFTEMVCERCISLAKKTCVKCGSVRKPAGTDDNGKPICQPCLDTKAEAFECPVCQRTDVRPAKKGMCWDCWNVERAQKAQNRLAEKFVTPAYQTLFTRLHDFVLEVSTTYRFADSAGSVYFPFFQRLEAAIPDPADISVEAIYAMFSAKEINANSLPMLFLQREGIVPVVCDDYTMELKSQRKQTRVIDMDKDAWYHGLLVDFQGYLQGKRDKFANHGYVGIHERVTNRSIETQLIGARRFLRWLPDHVSEAHEINQTFYDEFLVAVGTCAGNISTSFVKWLSRYKLPFRQVVKKESVRFAFNSKNILPEKRYYDLLGAFQELAGTDPKRALMLMLMGVYGQKARNLVKVTLSDVTQNKHGAVVVQIKGKPIEVVDEVADLLKAYFKTRRANIWHESLPDTECLFLGQRPGCPAEPSIVRKYLAQHDVTEAELRNSAIYYGIRRGIKTLHGVVYTFGLRADTAIAFLNMMGELPANEAKAVKAETVQRLANEKPSEHSGYIPLPESPFGESTCWLYVLECLNGFLYTGISNDPIGRYDQHRQGKGGRYTRNNRPFRMLAVEPYPSKSEAVAAERKLKRLSTEEKWAWIRWHSGNPNKGRSIDGVDTYRRAQASRR